jgi:hypothetical protein
MGAGYICEDAMSEHLKICIQRATTRQEWDAMQDDYINRAVAAADRIQKLEAALLDLSEGWECCPVSQAMRRVARKALEGKDD